MRMGVSVAMVSVAMLNFMAMNYDIFLPMQIVNVQIDLVNFFQVLIREKLFGFSGLKNPLSMDNNETFGIISEQIEDMGNH